MKKRDLVGSYLLKRAACSGCLTVSAFTSLWNLKKKQSKWETYCCISH